MTSKTDNFEDRVGKLGEGLEQTLGVPQDGMQDPTGEYPKVDYHYGSTVNKGARGTQVNELYVGGGDIGLSLDIAEQRPSEYPFNQVQETQSGHVVEYDDTPGGERILIKHRKGAGVEMRADGSVIVSAVNNKIEVTGGDQTAIIEGHGNLVYKGNLNLVVTGDYNVDVGGNHTMRVHGSETKQIDQNLKELIHGRRTTDIRKHDNRIVGGNDFNLIYKKSRNYIRGDHKQWIEGSNEIAVENDMFTSAKNSYAVTSKTSSLVGNDFVSLKGNDGTIGGKKVDFTGQSYMGHNGPQPFTSGATFYGSFHGQATEAMFSRYAWKAEKSKFAENAEQANSAVAATSAGGLGDAGSASATSIPTGGAPETVHNQEVHGPDGPPPVPPLIGSYTTMGDFAIRTVVVDANDTFKNAREKVDDYFGKFDTRPTTQEIRSSFKDDGNVSILGGVLVADGLLNSDYKRRTPPKIGRTSSAKPTPRFGFTPIGNSTQNRGKRFTPKGGRQ